MTTARSHGREAELADLRGAADDAAGGRGRAVLVTGEPGIGKTLLVEDAARHAREHGTRVVVVRCPSDAGAPPSWPWSEALRAVASGGAGPGPADLLVAPTRRPPARSGEDESARFELFSLVARALHDQAAATPVALVLDDLHWADTPTLQLFEHVAGTLHSMPLLLVGTYRDVDVDPGHPLAGLAARLPGDTLRLELRALAPDPLARLLADVTGIEAGDRLVRRVHRHTGGNPLFAREVARLLAADGRLAAGAPDRRLALPDGVRGVIERRLESFPPGAVDVLRWAALSGDEFDPDLIERAVDGGDVHRALAAARRRRLVEPVPDGDGDGRGARDRHRFTHGLVADTVRDGLSPDERRRRHLRLGQVLAEDAPGAAPPAAAISRHLQAALPEGDPLVAADHTVRAARQAAEALAWEEAARLYDRALAAVEVAGPPGARTAELLIERAAVVARTGHGPEAQRAASLAVEAARRLTGEPELLARAALTLSARTFADAGDAAIADLLEVALAGLVATDSPLRAELLARLAEELAHLDRPRSIRLVDDALALATRLEQPTAVWEALIQRHRLQRGTADLDERLATSTELVRRAEALHDPERTLLGQVRRVVDLMAAGRRLDADREQAAFARTVERAQAQSFRWYLPLWSGTRALAEGRLADARARADEVGAQALPRGAYAQAQFGIQLAGLQLQQDSLADAEGFLAMAADSYPTIPVYRCALAFVQAELGRHASAQALLAPLAPDAFAAVPLDQEWTTAAFCIAETCVAAGRADWGQALYDRLLPYAAQQAVTGGGALHLGAVAASLGRLATLAGDLDGADRHLRTAVAASEYFGAPLWAAHAQVDRAGVLQARGDRGDQATARRLVDEAATFAAEARVPRLQRRLDETAAPAPAVAVAGAGAPTNVFRREGDHWTVTYRTSSVRQRDRKGMHDLALLMTTPGQEHHVLELVAAQGEPRPDSGGDDALDATARASLRQRLVELQDELDEAERHADIGRAEKARDELEAVAAHLGAALGLGQRPRRLADPVERARKTVWRRLRTSIDAIAAAHPTLGRHLDRSLRTGTYCSYSPEHPTPWTTT